MVCAFFSFMPFTSHAKADRHGLIDLQNIFMGKLSEIIGQARLINGSNLLQQDCGFTFQKFTVNNDMCRLCLLFLYRGYGSDNRCRTEPVPDIVLQDQDRTCPVLFAANNGRQIGVVDFASFYVFHSVVPPKFISKSAKGGSFRKSGLVFRPLRHNIVLRIDRYLTSFPLGQWEHIFRLCIQPHWNFTTPWFSPGRPPLLRRLAADMPLHARL